MTREDIDRIALEYFNDRESEHEMDEVFELAKKALEQEPCEDCISRQAVIDMTGLSEWFESSDSYNEFVISLSELPPVTPQQKTGHWIDADGDNAICSCCNRLNHLYGTYCKHCGVKMIEPQESEISE